MTLRHISMILADAGWVPSVSEVWAAAGDGACPEFGGGHVTGEEFRRVPAFAGREPRIRLVWSDGVRIAH